MIITTTPNIENKPVKQYLGIVFGQNMILGGLRGLKAVKDSSLKELQERAEELGADAIIGVTVAYDITNIDSRNVIHMVTASGTAVKF